MPTRFRDRIAGAAGGPDKYVWLFNDVTKLWHHGEKLRHQAYHDALTGLPNRALLIEKLEQAIGSLAPFTRRLALLFLDPDGFKGINDRLGHKGGDDVLRIVARKLLRTVRQADTVARMGGDEFIIVLENPADKDEVGQIAARIVRAIGETMDIGGHSVVIDASIGISLYPENGQAVGGMLNGADRAMYAAKQAGKNTWRLFDDLAAKARVD